MSNRRHFSSGSGFYNPGSSQRAAPISRFVFLTTAIDSPGSVILDLLKLTLWNSCDQMRPAVWQRAEWVVHAMPFILSLIQIQRIPVDQSSRDRNYPHLVNLGVDKPSDHPELLDLTGGKIKYISPLVIDRLTHDPEWR
jgi:hypothetical protein